MKEKKKCNIQDCENFSRTRGLCANCYQSLLDMVRKGETDWDELTDLGVSTPTAVRKKLRDKLIASINEMREAKKSEKK